MVGCDLGGCVLTRGSASRYLYRLYYDYYIYYLRFGRV